MKTSLFALFEMFNLIWTAMPFMIIFVIASAMMGNKKSQNMMSTTGKAVKLGWWFLRRK